MKQTFYSIKQKNPPKILFAIGENSTSLDCILKYMGHNPIPVECSTAHKNVDESIDLVIANLDKGVDSQKLLELKEKYGYSLIFLTLHPEKTDVYNLVRDGADAWIDRPYTVPDLVDFAFKILQHREKQKNIQKKDAVVIKNYPTPIYQTSIEDILVSAGHRVRSTKDKIILHNLLLGNVKTLIMHDYHDPDLSRELHSQFPFLNILSNNETRLHFEEEYTIDSLIEVIGKKEKETMDRIANLTRQISPFNISLSGPSGAGKTAVSYSLQIRLPFINVIPRYKSRDARPFEFSSQSIHTREEQMISEIEQYAFTFYHRGSELVGIKKSDIENNPYNIIPLANIESLRLASDYFRENVKKIYLTASTDILLKRLEKRFSDPSFPKTSLKSIKASIEKQKEDFQMYESKFDEIIDTSELNPDEVSRMIIDNHLLG